MSWLIASPVLMRKQCRRMLLLSKQYLERNQIHLLQLSTEWRQARTLHCATLRKLSLNSRKEKHYGNPEQSNTV